jgi:predicted nucleic acid-binding protein
MRDYLIDTNIWEYWFNEKREPQHGHVLNHVSSLKKHSYVRLHISSVTWGEIAYGYRALKDKDRSLETPFRQFLHGIAPNEYRIDRSVTDTYGRIRACLFEKCLSETKKKGLRPEQLLDPVTSLQLRIQENDLWIVAQAVTRDLTLITNDRKSLQPLLQVLGDELHVENWATEDP